MSDSEDIEEMKRREREFQPTPFMLSFSKMVNRGMIEMPSREFLEAMYYWESWSFYIRGRPTVDDVNEAGIIPVFLDIWQHWSGLPDFQSDVATCVADIAELSPEHAKLVVDYHDVDVIPMLVPYLRWSESDSIDMFLLQEAARILGYTALVSPRYSDLVLKHGAFESLVSVLKQAVESKVSVLKQAVESKVHVMKQRLQLLTLEAVVGTLSNLCCSMGSAPLEKVKAALPVLRELICLDDQSIVEDACFALSVLSQDPREKVQTFIEGGVCPRLVDLLQHRSDKVTMLAVETLGNLLTCDDAQIQVEGVCPRLVDLLQHPSDTVTILALETLRNLVTSDDALIQVEGFCPRLVDLLQHPSDTVTILALKTLENLICDDARIQLIIDIKVLPCLYQLLTHQNDIIKEAACQTISNITAGNGAQVQAVMEANIFCPLVHHLRHPKLGIKSKAALAVSNATSKISHEQIWSLVSQGCIKPLCDLLTCTDPMIVKVCLEGLENILEAAKTDEVMGVLYDGVNIYAEMVSESEGFVKIENLRRHDNNDVNEKAVNILERYWAEDKIGRSGSPEWWVWLARFSFYN